MARLVILVLATQGGFLCLAFAGATWHGKPARPGLGLNRPEKPLTWPVAAGLVTGIILLSFSLAFLLQYSGIRESSALAELERRFAEIEPRHLPYLLLGVALLPAFAEELLFRGFLLGSLAGRFGNGVGLLTSAFLFGAAHFDLAQGTAAFVLGLYLGGIRLRTGSVHAGMLCHASNNAIAVLAPHFLSVG
ncbi:MAG: type II CAAX endopeptidase family protein [Myxococcota bacterium]|nr:type II CAAX endopeptidase family protein [Myxococcota bacterium]